MPVLGLVSRERDPDSAVAAGERIESLRHALTQLNSLDSQILVMRHIEQLSVSQVSQRLLIPEGTVKSRHFHALTRLRILVSHVEPGVFT